MSYLEKYKQTTEREVIAPSGITYMVRGLSSVEYGNALGGIPGLLSSGDKSETSLADVLNMQRTVCDYGTVSASYGGETSTAGNGLPPAADWPASDLAAVFMAIQQASGLSGAEADAARGAL